MYPVGTCLNDFRCEIGKYARVYIMCSKAAKNVLLVSGHSGQMSYYISAVQDICPITVLMNLSPCLCAPKGGIFCPRLFNSSPRPNPNPTPTLTQPKP